MPEIFCDFKVTPEGAWSNVPDGGYKIAGEVPQVLRFITGVSGHADGEIVPEIAEVTLNPDGTVTTPDGITPVIEDGYLTGLRVQFA